MTGYKNAYPNYHVPRIGGQSRQYLVNALTEYKKGKRKHPTMQAQAMSFSDEDIAAIAAYLAARKPAARTNPVRKIDGAKNGVVDIGANPTAVGAGGAGTYGGALRA